MLPQLGQLSLTLALCLSVLAVVSGVLFHRQASIVWHQLTVSTVVGQFVFIAFAFAFLVWSFVSDDFSVAYVTHNSNSLLPWYFKVSATWGGHEGSFLLWVLIMTLWMCAVVVRRHNYPLQLSTSVLAVLSLLNLCFILYVVFASNPFELLIPMTPADGGDLNPVLQDFGLIVHPPLLYVGYVGLAVPFAFAVSALLHDRVDSAWARWTRPWANVAWSFLTVGIALGSWWAYYELGWGGWWFWDPVENASFMPWLAAAALVHSLAVTEKRGAFRNWTVLLAITAFSLSLLGAFIVRSGVLTSVHAFAVDPTRGAYILAFLALVVGGSLTLFGLRSQRSQTTLIGFKWLSREFFMLVNNGILVLALTVVLWGTLAPIGYEAFTGAKISIGPPFFDRFFVPLMLLLAVAVGLVPVLNWKRTSLQALSGTLKVAVPLALILGLLVWFSFDFKLVTVAAALVFALWVVITHSMDVIKKIRSSSQFPLAYVGMTLAHVGFAMSIVGVAVTSTASIERDLRMSVQQTTMLGDAEVQFLGVSQVEGVNYTAQQGTFVVSEKGHSYTLHPEKRRYWARDVVMTEAAINPGFFSDTYISLGEPLNDGAWAVRLHYKPLVRWSWLGALMIALGGVVAVFDRRYRSLRVREVRKATQNRTDSSAANAQAN